MAGISHTFLFCKVWMFYCSYRYNVSILHLKFTLCSNFQVTYRHTDENVHTLCNVLIVIVISILQRITNYYNDNNNRYLLKLTWIMEDPDQFFPPNHNLKYQLWPSLFWTIIMRESEVKCGCSWWLVFWVVISAKVYDNNFHCPFYLVKI